MQTATHTINVANKGAVTSVWQIPGRYTAALIIAHGAGQDMNSEFISYLHEQIAAQDILTVKFNFPYLEQGRKAPDRPPVLEATWLSVIARVLEKTGLQPEQLFLSGKSMGGRYASLLAARQQVYAGVLLYGYPLHAPGKIDQPRCDHFPDIHCPVLFFQGTRDALCNLAVLQEKIPLLPTESKLHVIEGGDHSFKVLKRLARTQASVWEEIANMTVTWIKQH